jgi:hypothetical protein
VGGGVGWAKPHTGQGGTPKGTQSKKNQNTIKKTTQKKQKGVGWGGEWGVWNKKNKHKEKKQDTKKNKTKLKKMEKTKTINKKHRWKG